MEAAMRRIGWWVVLGMLAGTATAGDFAGQWKVIEQGQEGALRTLREFGGRLVLVRTPELEGKRLDTLYGSSVGDHAELSTPGLRGMTSTLLDEDAAPTPVRLRLKRFERDGRTLARATYSRDDAVILREEWVLAQAPLIEIVSVSPSTAFDPKRDGPLLVRVRLRGDEPREVRLEAELPEGDGPRRAFYQEALRVTGTRTIPAQSAWKHVQPGVHLLELTPRDSTDAKRLLLGGSYLLAAVVNGLDPAIGRAEGRFNVRPPRAEHLAPQWLSHPSSDVFSGAPAVHDSPDATALQRDLAKSMRKVGNRTPSPQTLLEPDDFGHRMGRAASVVISTHGSPKGVYTYVPSGDEPEVAGHARPLELAQNSLRIDGESLRDHLPTGKKPLKDLHYVVLYSCLTGGGDFPRDLVDMGVDLVVAFDQVVPTSAGPHFTRRLFNDLSGQGRAADPVQEAAGQQPVPGVRSLGWAAREAASFADGAWFALLPWSEQRKVKKICWSTPLRSSIRIVSAPGIDPNTETAVPARHGNSTN